MFEFIEIFEMEGYNFNTFIEKVHQFVNKFKKIYPEIDMGYVAYSVFESKDALE